MVQPWCKFSASPFTLFSLPRGVEAPAGDTGAARNVEKCRQGAARAM
jgi:hypothetical protein